MLSGCATVYKAELTVVDVSAVIATDDYLTTELDSPDICEIEVYSVDKNGLLMLSITNFLTFSHRRPKNTNEIIVKNVDVQFIVDSKPKGYQILRSPVLIQIPMNLNFRSILMFSQPIPCNDDEILTCSNSEECFNCSLYCFPKELKCDGFDTCGENESNCNIKTPRIPHSSYKYGREALSSSQIMLIWFFALNGSFIVFFLLLSLCSAGFMLCRCRFYSKNSKESRHTFIRYLREAIPPVVPDVENGKESTPESNSAALNTPQPPTPSRQRHSILSRINFQPAPTLKELEPEVEDREQSPTESICSPPAHQPEVFFRRQSLPFPQLNPSLRKERAMSFQH